MKKICLLFGIVFLVFNIVCPNFVMAEPYRYTNRNADEKINTEPDFGPYMRELQMRIKANWEPPIDYRTKRVILLFKIAKDGSLQACSVFKSSGIQKADKAALKAVEVSAPFKPLPSEFKGKSIDIQFTFDYNVFK